MGISGVTYCTLREVRILEIKKVSSYVKCFRSVFLQFCGATVKVLILAGQLSTCL